MSRVPLVLPLVLLSACLAATVRGDLVDAKRHRNDTWGNTGFWQRVNRHFGIGWGDGYHAKRPCPKRFVPHVWSGAPEAVTEGTVVHSHATNLPPHGSAQPTPAIRHPAPETHRPPSSAVLMPRREPIWPMAPMAPMAPKPRPAAPTKPATPTEPATPKKPEQPVQDPLTDRPNGGLPASPSDREPDSEFPPLTLPQTGVSGGESVEEILAPTEAGATE